MKRKSVERNRTWGEKEIGGWGRQRERETEREREKRTTIRKKIAHRERGRGRAREKIDNMIKSEKIRKD